MHVCDISSLSIFLKSNVYSLNASSEKCFKEMHIHFKKIITAMDIQTLYLSTHALSEK